MTKKEENLICQKCGKCCESYWIFTRILEEVERFETLKTDKIEIIKIKNGLWNIRFHFPCKHLIKKDDKFHCAIYNKKRPTYCTEYPRNFLIEYKTIGEEYKEIFENEVKFCLLLKKISKENDGV